MQLEKDIARYQPRSVRRPRIAKDARERERAHPQGGSEANDGEAVAQASARATLLAGGVLFFGLNSSRAMTRWKGGAGSDASAPVAGWVTTGCLKHNLSPLPCHPAERVKRDAANDAATREARQSEAAVVSMASSFWFSRGRPPQCASVVSVALHGVGKVRTPGKACGVFWGKEATKTGCYSLGCGHHARAKFGEKSAYSGKVANCCENLAGGRGRGSFSG